MKRLFIPAKYIGECKLKNSMIAQLPKKIGLVTTAQFLNSIPDIKKQLENSGKVAFIGKSMQGNDGQLLGCDVSSAIAIDELIEAFLYIGSGEFHPRGIGLKTTKEIFVFNPLTEILSKLGRKEILAYKNKKRSAYIRFLHAKNIGILVSTKQGQNNLRRALEFKKKLRDKNCFVFISETIDFSELENFPFIESWVNTACPRIDEDIKCLNLVDVEAILKN